MGETGGMGKRKYSIDTPVPSRVTAPGTEQVTSPRQEGEKKEQ